MVKVKRRSHSLNWVLLWLSSILLEFCFVHTREAEAQLPTWDNVLFFSRKRCLKITKDHPRPSWRGQGIMHSCQRWWRAASEGLQQNRWPTSLPLSSELCWVSQLEPHGILNCSRLLCLFVDRVVIWADYWTGLWSQQSSSTLKVFFRNVSKYKKMSGDNSEDTAGWLLFVSVAAWPSMTKSVCLPDSTNASHSY